MMAFFTNISGKNETKNNTHKKTTQNDSIKKGTREERLTVADIKIPYVETRDSCNQELFFFFVRAVSLNSRQQTRHDRKNEQIDGI